MVHKSIARIVKFVFVEQSHVLTLIDHKSFNYFISGCRTTSRELFGFFGPGINMVNNKNSLFMHISGGWLYSVRKTCHNECCLTDIPNGLNPYVLNLKYIPAIASEIWMYFVKCFQALAWMSHLTIRLSMLGMSSHPSSSLLRLVQSFQYVCNW